MGGAGRRAGNVRARRSFGRAPGLVDVPDSIELQRSSFDRLVQQGVPPAERANVGLQRAFASVFPVKNNAGTALLEFVGYELDLRR